MNAKELSEAITHLRPNAEYVFQENDYSTIEWQSLEGNPPTYAELEKASKELKKNALEKEAQAALNKAAAEAKLAALGLTADDLKALGL